MGFDEPNPQWTDNQALEYALAAIRFFAAEFGRPPTATYHRNRLPIDLRDEALDALMRARIAVTASRRRARFVPAWPSKTT